VHLARHNAKGSELVSGMAAGVYGFLRLCWDIIEKRVVTHAGAPWPVGAAEEYQHPSSRHASLMVCRCSQIFTVPGSMTASCVSSRRCTATPRLLPSFERRMPLIADRKHPTMYQVTHDVLGQKGLTIMRL
jgi:hypothetical protein